MRGVNSLWRRVVFFWEVSTSFSVQSADWEFGVQIRCCVCLRRWECFFWMKSSWQRTGLKIDVINGSWQSIWAHCEIARNYLSCHWLRSARLNYLAVPYSSLGQRTVTWCAIFPRFASKKRDILLEVLHSSKRHAWEASFNWAESTAPEDVWVIILRWLRLGQHKPKDGISEHKNAVCGRQSFYQCLLFGFMCACMHLIRCCVFFLIYQRSDKDVFQGPSARLKDVFREVSLGGLRHSWK